MEFSKVLEERRSVRKYNDLSLSKGTIKTILEYAILAPSAHNRQPWYFVVVQNQDKKKEIGDILEEKMGPQGKKTSDVIRDAQVLVLVFIDIEDEVMDLVSVGASIENMVLKARDLDVASLWIGYILNIREEVKRIVKVNKKLVSAVALGYTNAFPSKRPRKELEEVSLFID